MFVEIFIVVFFRFIIFIIVIVNSLSMFNISIVTVSDAGAGENKIYLSTRPVPETASDVIVKTSHDDPNPLCWLVKGGNYYLATENT